MSVDPDRLRDLTFEFVQVKSPTGDTAEVARLYGRQPSILRLRAAVRLARSKRRFS